MSPAKKQKDLLRDEGLSPSQALIECKRALAQVKRDHVIATTRHSSKLKYEWRE